MLQAVPVRCTCTAVGHLSGVTFGGAAEDISPACVVYRASTCPGETNQPAHSIWPLLKTGDHLFHLRSNIKVSQSWLKKLVKSVLKNKQKCCCFKNIYLTLKQIWRSLSCKMTMCCCQSIYFSCLTLLPASSSSLVNWLDRAGEELHYRHPQVSYRHCRAERKLAF